MHGRSSYHRLTAPVLPFTANTQLDWSIRSLIREGPRVASDFRPLEDSRGSAKLPWSFADQSEKSVDECLLTKRIRQLKSVHFPSSCYEMMLSDKSKLFRENTLASLLSFVLAGCINSTVEIRCVCVWCHDLRAVMSHLVSLTHKYC